MADTIISPKQLAPSATSEGTLYTVPAATTFVASSLLACNTGAVQATIRARIGVAGAAANPKQYIWYDCALSPYSNVVLTAGITMSATDVLYVQSDTGDVGFSLYGVETT